MDGSMRSAIVKDDLVNPQGLVIDFEERKLFWADAHKDCIEIANLNGKDRRSLMPLDAHPIGLTQVILICFFNFNILMFVLLNEEVR